MTSICGKRWIEKLLVHDRLALHLPHICNREPESKDEQERGKYRQKDILGC